MRIANLITLLSLCSAVCCAQSVAQRVQQLSQDVATLKSQRAPAAAGLTPGGPVEVRSSSGAVVAAIGPKSIVGGEDGGGHMLIFNGTGRRVASFEIGTNRSTALLAIDDANGQNELAQVSATADGRSGLILLDGPGAQYLVNGMARDYAEVFEIADRGGIRPGSVVVESSNGRGLTLASGAYNPAVVGVVAGAGDLHSGMVIGSRDDGTADLPVATGGQVFVRVSTESGSIAVGDLLVSSGAPGVAMRGADSTRLTGTVVGKALQPYSGDGEGLIRMLVLNR